jgi:guanine deaminase
VSTVIRGQTLTFGRLHDNFTHHEDGAIVISDDGKIAWAGAWHALPDTYGTLLVHDYQSSIVMPGFIDPHIHFPQYRMLAAPAKDLLDWLTRYTWPEESLYAGKDHATVAADAFLDRLAQCGTTSALAFCSVHKTCAEALFEAASKRGMALITGKTMMDRNAIPAVQDDPETSAQESEELYRTWHGRGRLRYAVSPRFAITSSDAQLLVAGELMASMPGALMQTHLSESAHEIETVMKLFPGAKDYADIYDRFGLLGAHSLFAHGIHLSDRECQRLSESGSSVIHCPTSNSFLGSGIMRMAHLRNAKHPVPLGLATDIGGGTNYSMLATMAEAYKLQMLAGVKLSAFELFHMSTRGNANRLKLGGEIGSLESGAWADLVVLDPAATPVLNSRHALSESLEDTLFSLMILGDDRAIRATYIAGHRVHERVR